MTQDILLALIAFALVTSVTPGPNNLMLMASGANFGFSRTLPHMLGISLGHAFMVFLVGLGVAQIFVVYPALGLVLKGVATIYMIWLAWQIAQSAAPSDGGGRGQPMTFLQAAAFQWVNPKAWAMALTATTVYAPGTGIASMLLVAVVFASVNLPSISVWAWMGQKVRRILTRPGRLVVFNRAMAVLLVASMWPVLRM
jgi:threonine/homoserine/homoserine lactone efflux protein